VYFYTSGYANIWDDGYPSGGNYWSDYTGADLCNGPYQNETGSDGIGDSPYIIDENNTDSYPLMNPWGTGTPATIFTWVPSTPKVGELVTFDASSSTPNGGTITKYEWNFGDGEYATGQIVTHAYSSPDTYIVALNVTDSEGLWDIEQKQIQVTVISVPVGGYSFPIKDYAIEKPLTLYLALVAILTVSFTIAKRRKKQQN